VSDPNYNDVGLLLHFDGTDGSTTFTDDSSNGLTVTAHGNAQVDTAQSKFGGASLLLDGTGDYLTVADNAALDLGSGDFTIEAWIRPASLASKFPIYSQDGDVLGAAPVSIYVDTDGSVVLEQDAWPTVISSSGAVVVNAWQHVALVRDYWGDVSVYVDGISRGLSGAGGAYTSTEGHNIGALLVYGSFTDYADGHIDDLRITPGVERYTGNFTPPTAAFPNSAAAIGSDVRVSLESPLGAPESTITIRPPSDIRVSLPSPVGLPSAVLEMAKAAFVSLPSPLAPPKASVLCDFTSLITDTTERYVVQLTGNPVVSVPVSSWQATVQKGQQSFLQVVVPAASQYLSELSSRLSTGEFIVLRETEIDGQTVRSEMARARIDDVTINEGPTNSTATVRGYTTAFDDSVSAQTVTLRKVRSRSQTLGGASRVRCSIDWLLRPGQTVTDGEVTFDVAYINYFVPTVGDSYMDVGTRG